MEAPINDGSEKFLDVPYDQRWELLKPTIVRIYMEENNKIARVAERMKGEYSFDAQVHQYRYQFKKWEIKKRITTEEKGAVITTLGKRRREDGASTSNVTINQGGYQKEVDKKQLKRYINQSTRQSQLLTWSPGLFLRRDLPYAALVGKISGQNQLSPPSGGPITPDYLTVVSPQAGGSPSEPQNVLSPTMQLIRKKVLLDRARLFLDGREQELMAGMSRDEKKSAATWLHDLWMYSFITAKYWGRGPKAWTLPLINFKSFGCHPVPSTPDNINLDSMSGSSPTTINIGLQSREPTQLCRWTIHYKEEVKYERTPSPPLAMDDEFEEKFDVDDESTWSVWRATGPLHDLSGAITQALQQNTFSAIQPEDLPLAADSLTKAIERSPDELRAETFGFAIMSRNMPVLDEIFEYYKGDVPECFSTIFPFHLAARFLDGGKSCCLVMSDLVNGLGGSNSIAVNYVDNLGLTVLDALFVSILRSHSKTTLTSLGDAFIGQTRYHGEEVDPCGRWDADSPCVRRLYALGKAAIPSQWKHMFCHTSVQAVCHNLSAIFMTPMRPNINTPSGLFARRCGHCGLELKPGPLHALVLTAFHLASSGMPGENLFGMVSCLVCLLTLRADPCVTAEVSFFALLGQDADECQHPPMNATELASQVPSQILESWSVEARLGWEVLNTIMRHDIDKRRRGSDITKEYEWRRGVMDRTHFLEVVSHPKIIYYGNRKLGLIWAAMQAELLTYRRLEVQDSWLSPRFDMMLLLRGLTSDDDEYLVALGRGDADAGEDRLQRYSLCGLFYDTDNPGCARREEVCKSYYANLDDWKRSAFIRAQEFDYGFDYRFDYRFDY
ncbi:uncharacterized protein F4822DRAFT_342116 [Hypoxylon trugodes]|uniref:uncharacterized protein n=1 Tax=Hypoxylon trugodes TaxID=326681 RepID=UPI00219D668E|nr:uncharacterized protein F4822DRAFT_342116 [Hypoxylon trugodes]KAI1385355.1 hypothetical protein F4822DRAFT_342116 [Hypoxylon trugodes]